MTTEELRGQRDELAAQHQAHLSKAAECVGAMRLIDYWIGRLETPQAPEPAEQRTGDEPT